MNNSLINTHDSKIVGILIDDIKNIRLILDNGMKRIVTFNNSICMKIDNFQIGNILLEINIYTGLMQKIELCKSLCFLYDIKETELQSDWIKSIIKKINSKSLILVELIETYGAHGVILCESYFEKNLTENCLEKI